MEAHDVVAWRALVRRGRVRQKDIGLAHGVGLNAVKAMLIGQTYTEVPGALTQDQIDFPEFLNDRAKVRRLRDRFRCGAITFTDLRRLCREAGTAPTRSEITGMLTGRSYADVPGALSIYEVEARSRRLDTEVVLFIRLQYDPPLVHTGTLAKAYGLSQTCVTKIITGKTYPDVPGSVALRRGRGTARFRSKEVVAIRQRFRDEQPSLTQRALAQELGLGETNLHELLIGVSYSDVPGALSPEEIKAFQIANRRLPPEVALFMRLQHRPGVVSCLKLGRVYGVSHEHAVQIVTGKVYRDVPCAVANVGPPGAPRKITDEQVIKARRQYRSRHVTFRELAQDYGLSRDRMQQIVRGYGRKELPEAVPEHVRSKPLYSVRMHSKRRRASHKPPVALQAAE